MYYYDQNSYYYYNQNQYYDQEAYYGYGNYNSSHRNPSTRRKQPRSNQTAAESNVNEEPLTERKHATNLLEKPNAGQPTNVMSNIDMWDPQTENPVKTSKKLIEKRRNVSIRLDLKGIGFRLAAIHERKYPNEIVSSSTVNENSLPLHQRASSEVCRSASKISQTPSFVFFSCLVIHRSLRAMKPLLERSNHQQQKTNPIGRRR